MHMTIFPLELFQYNLSVGQQTLHRRDILPWDGTLFTEKLVFSVRACANFSFCLNHAYLRGQGEKYVYS